MQPGDRLDLSALASRLPRHPITRFAPAPTGYLHLGHAANAAWVWGLARALDGRVLLRVEDHDRTRCRPEYEAALVEDLEWLGLLPDAPDPDTLRSGASPYRQSDSEAAYAAALGRLTRERHVYACECSRKDIAGGAEAFGDDVRYSGRCRNRRLAAGDGRGVRLEIDAGEVTFVDGLLGEQRQEPLRQCGDLQPRHRAARPAIGRRYGIRGAGRSGVRRWDAEPTAKARSGRSPRALLALGFAAADRPCYTMWPEYRTAGGIR